MTDEILMKVERPARYLGNELHMVKKDPAGLTRFCLCFPDVYEVGMSHLGLQILYFFLNRRADTYCERAFAPWLDMEALLRAHEIPLSALETQAPLKDFDFVGFTLQYEMSYTNLVNMLDLGGIPIFSAQREQRVLEGEALPLVIAGGPCAVNPEPLADLVDIFYLGEGEVMLDEIMDLYRKNKENNGTRLDFLESLLEVEGVYVPRFYDVSYTDGNTETTKSEIPEDLKPSKTLGTSETLENLKVPEAPSHTTAVRIASFQPNHPKAKAVIKKVFTKNLDECFYPEKMLVPLMETVHERSMVELFRGCRRGCRFCSAGYIYRPVRERKPDTLVRQAKSLIKASGYDELSLISLSTGDYSCFGGLTEALLEAFQEDKVNLSLPSLRVDAFNLALMAKVQSVRKSSLTFAPEAGTERMRAVVNKNLSREEILEGCSLAYQGGWERIKLYFMVGLPMEEREDILGIVHLSEEIVEKYYEVTDHKRPVNVVVSTSCFVPKPFTPFQWEAQDGIESLNEKQHLIKNSFKKKQIKYNYHDSELSLLEGVISRGDRRLAKVIVKAWELGARYDGWSDHFKFELWEQALQDSGLKIEDYTRRRGLDEILPWDHIAVGVTKEFLQRELQLSRRGITTPDCGQRCAGCGIGKEFCKDLHKEPVTDHGKEGDSPCV